MSKNRAQAEAQKPSKTASNTKALSRPFKTVPINYSSRVRNFHTRLAAVPSLATGMTDKPKDNGEELAKVWLPVPGDDDSQRKGYRWPASHLTSADMEKLTQLRARSGRPITVLIHEAVSVLFELTRSDMAKVEQLALRTGKGINEVLAQAIHFMYEGETGNDKYGAREANDQHPLRVHPASDDTSPESDGV